MNTATQQNLIEDHISYAKALAAKARQQVGMPARVDQDELEGWALLGLVQAAGRFDASRGVAFTTFSYRRIIGSVLNGVGKMQDAPSSTRDRARRQERLQAALPEGFTNDMTADQAERAIANATQRVGAVVALDAIAEAPATSDNDPLSQVVHQENLDRMRSAIAQLPGKLAKIVELYHFGGKSMADVAKQLGLSAATVCRWNDKAMKQIANAMGVEQAVAC